MTTTPSKRLDRALSLVDGTPAPAVEETPAVQSTPSAEILAAALRYARAGYRVVPAWWITPTGACACPSGLACRKPAKHPIPSDWPHVATTDEGQVRVWWRDYPQANVGLTMGNGVVAVDIDNTYAREELDTQGLPLATPTQHTGSGGWHRLYRWTGKKLKNAVRFMEGADIRTDGGFIVVEPSRNTKGAYWWEPGLEPWTVPLAELPPWVADLCAAENRTVKPPLQIGDLWVGVSEGARNGRLFSYACKMRRERRPELEIMAVCLELARRCVPPLAQAEVESIVASSGRYLDKREDDGLVMVSVWPDLMQMELKPKVELVVPWLRERDITMFHSWRGIGKTWVTLSLGLAISTGTKFLKWDVPAPRGVLLIDGEMSTFDLRKRLAALMKGNGEAPMRCPFNLISHDFQERGIPSLDTSAGQELVERKLDGVDLILLDNISTLFRGGGDENEASSWDTAQEWLLKMRKSGRTVCLAHHSGKTGAQRGTSKREDVLDSVINLRRPSDYKDGQGARIEIKFEKLRGVSGRAVEPFEIKLEQTGNKGLIWTMRDGEAAREEQVLELLDLGMAQNVIANELMCSRSTIARVVKRLKREGKLNGVEVKR